jgi:O-methyltransferase
MVADDYLELLKRCLTRYDLCGSEYQPFEPSRGVSGVALLRAILQRWGLDLVRRQTFDPAARAVGVDHPAFAETMIGLRRLENINHCVTDVVRRGVPGDVIEAGVWRGGAVIFMRAVLKALGVSNRTVWVADSFAGLPPPTGEYPADIGDEHYKNRFLAVSLEDVRRNFARYGLLDDQVRFLVGWFSDTLPEAPIEQLAVLRVDGDMYESTMDVLRHLYPKLSPGGYVIVDDYGALEQCRLAVEDYRSENGVTDPITEIDWTGVFWQKGSGDGGAYVDDREDVGIQSASSMRTAPTDVRHPDAGPSV